MSIDLAAAAAAYAQRGWPIFPLRAHGKEPATPNGFKDATTDLVQVQRWWQENPQYNIAAVPGRTGHLVFDLDGAEGTVAAERLGLLAIPTLRVLTARGQHLWFQHPGGGSIANRVLAPHVDVRGDAGYVIMPPSIHPSGTVYRWRGKTSDALSVPAGIVGRLRNGGTLEPVVLASGEPLPPGERNTTLTSLAGSMRRRGMEQEEIAIALLAVNQRRCRPPLPEGEVQAIAANVARYQPVHGPVYQHLAAQLLAEAGSLGLSAADRDRITADQIARANALRDQPATELAVWPWKTLDATLGKLRRTMMVVLGARPGLGKTTFVMNCITHWASHGWGIYALTTEMPPEEAWLRLAALALHIPPVRLLENELSWLAQELQLAPEDIAARLSAAVSGLRERYHGQLYFVEQGRVTPDQFAAHVAQAAQWGFRFVILDHILRMNFGEDNGNGNLTAAVTETVRRAKELAKEHHLTILLTAQANRPPREAGPLALVSPPPTTALKQSGALEEEPDLILMLHKVLRPGVEKEQLAAVRAARMPLAEVLVPGLMGIHIGKHRYKSSVVDRSLFLRVEPWDELLDHPQGPGDTF